MFKSSSRDIIDKFEAFVSDHHQLYMQLFNTHLKPKHHIIHYAKLLRNLLPLCHFWGMTFKNKNFESKLISQLIALELMTNCIF